MGPKGIPQALVLEKDNEENIDLLPMYWLIERWCKVEWGDTVVVTTPKKKTLNLRCWNKLPYLTREQLEQTLADLPDQAVPGRSGKVAGPRVSSALIVLGPVACAARLPQGQVKKLIRQSLEHLDDMIDKNKKEKMIMKYKCMTDHYYEDKPCSGPEDLGNETVMKSKGLEKG